MNERKTLYNLISLVLIAFALFYLAFGILRFVRNPYNDGFMRWTENYLTLNRINPMDVVLARPVDLSSLDYPVSMHHSITTIPWSYTLSNLIYPAILSPKAALYWCLILFLAISLTSIVIAFLKKDSKSILPPLLAIAVWASHSGWGSSISYANTGMFTCLSLIIIFYLLQRKQTLHTDVLIGILMSIAMLKPQIALLFFIPLLYAKRFRSILLSTFIVITSWLGSAFLTSTSPLGILLDQFRVGASLNETSLYTYYGLLTPLSNLGVSTTIILLVQAAIFIPLAFYLGWKYHFAPTDFQFALIAFLTSIWCYHHNMDLPILGFVVLFYLNCLMETCDGNYSTLTLLLPVLFHALPISYTWYDVSPIVPLIQRGVYLFMLLYAFRNSADGFPETPAETLPETR